MQDLKVGYLCFKNLTHLDLVGPFEVLSRVTSTSYIIGETMDAMRSPKGLTILPDYDLNNTPDFDILIVPGGNGQTPAMDNEPLISFIRTRHETCIYTGGVCTGTLLLAKAGILKGKKASTHWLAQHELSKFGAEYVKDRVLWSDTKTITGAGVSAGIDLALTLIAQLEGEEKAKEIQLAIEYDPAPPYNGGSVEKTSSATVQKLIGQSRFKENWISEKL